jgi:acetyl esterase/lipase
MAEGTVYIRTQAPGLLARVLQAGMPLLGMKGRIGRIVRTGKGRKIAARLSARLKRLCTVTVQQHAGRKVWTLVPKEGATQKTILYLHGGAYVANLLSFHWDLVADLMRTARPYTTFWKRCTPTCKPPTRPRSWC